MTPQEAIKILKFERGYFCDFKGCQEQQAYTMAIKALEQQPCEDTINRTELLSRIDEERKHLLDLNMDGAEHVIVHHARRIIEDMPSVIPKAESEDEE